MSKSDYELWVDKWNEKHIEYVSLGAATRNKLMADWLEEILAIAKKKYYTSDSSYMSDTTYDNFERDLRILRPDSKILKQVGHKL